MAPNLLPIRVTPKSSQNRVRVEKGIVRVSVTAPPVDGEANEAVIKLLGKSLGIAPSRLSVIRGSKGRDKMIDLGEMSVEEALRILS